MIVNDNEPLVSVLIPAYNHDKYVQDTIISIIEQTHKNIELLVIDDGSKDKTWQKINELKRCCEEHFRRIIFETQDNKGTCTTLNRLLDSCSMESSYVFIIASDDVALPMAIEKEADFLENNKEYGLCVGDNEIIDEAGNVCYWDKNHNNIYKKEQATYITFADALQKSRRFCFTSDRFGAYRELLKKNHVPNGYLIRKSVFNNFRFSLDAPLEDWNLMLHIAKNYKMKYLDEILLQYRWHNENSIKNIKSIKEAETKTFEFEKKYMSRYDKLYINFWKIKQIIKKGIR